VTWHGVRLDHPDWGDHSHSLAFTLRSLHARFQIHGIFNAYWEPLSFELPPVDASGQRWRRCIDTALAPPDDISHWSDAPLVPERTYLAQPRSVVLLALNLQGVGLGGSPLPVTP
jgi:glycogen operon protein